MRWRDGSKFQGEWKNDERLNGKMSFADQESYYKGWFRDDQYHGQGEICNGKNRFIGAFDKGKVP